MRKGSCSTDARPIFFENGMLYCKLTGASRIRKGQLHVIFVAVEIKNCGVLIKSFDLNQSFAFQKNFVLSKKATHSHNPIASLSMSVITYCHQKNSLRVRTEPNIQFCYAWSSQRFKSLPSILCEKAVRT